MKLFFAFILISFSLFSESKAKYLKETRATPLPVGIFYNPFDDKSITFIKAQGKDENGIFDLMLPNTTFLKINFVPWSNTNTQTKAYTCPGEENCLATRLHACAIEQHKDLEDGDHQIFHFVLCTMSHESWKTDPTEAAVQCVNQIGEWPDEGEFINECAKEEQQSDKHLADMKSQADAAKVTQVPWVTINGVRNEGAETDLKSAICNGIDGTKPEACGTTPAVNPLKVGIYYNPFNDNSIDLIKAQGKGGNGIFDLMLPNTTYLNINFVPWSNANTQTKAYTCPGEENCLATRLHACAIEQHKDLKDGDHQIFHFVLCTMSHESWKTDPTEAAVQCVNQIGEWPDEGEFINECAKEEQQSDKHLADMKSQADAAKVTQVPWVTINGERNENAEKDLKTEVCNSFDGTKPPACSTSGTTAAPGVTTQAPGGAVELMISKICLSLLIVISILINLH